MTVLFVQGGGEGTHDEWDNALVDSLRSGLGPGHEVRYPRMPDEGDPSYPRWSAATGREMAHLDQGAVVAGHSIGGTILVGGSVHDPTDPVGRLLFNVLAMVAEFESDLARMRTREGMKVARAKGRLRGKQPKLSRRQEAHLVALHGAGEHTIGELEELFSITRSTVYRALARDRTRASR